jgi:maltose O-acetyltransferase
MNFRKIFQKLRILKYRLLSNCKLVIGNPKINQPVQFVGGGTILFGKNVNLGYFPSPYFYNSCIYVEARNKETKIVFGDNIYINNNCVFIAEGEGIEIGSNTLIGTNCEIIDSDFHDLNPNRRTNGKAKTAKVMIGKNVFIGNNVKIMKGVTIGDYNPPTKKLKNF